MSTDIDRGKKRAFWFGIVFGITFFVLWASLMNEMSEKTCRELSGAKECKLQMLPVKEGVK